MSRIEDALAKASQRLATPTPLAKQEPAPALEVKSLVDPTGQCDDKLVVLKEPFSPEAEEFRKLKDALLNESKRKDSVNNVILITSPGRGEGKSLVSANLAVSLAQEYDHTVLLIDADVRLPTCNKYLGITAETGLTDCLLEGKDLGQLLVKTGIGKLILLPAGKPAKDPLEMFSSNSMRQLLQDIKHRYADRIILIDTPPLLMFTETRTLAGLADSVILVVREGESSLDEVKECLGLLKNKVMGLVYNSTDFAQPSHTSYYNYPPYERTS